MQHLSARDEPSLADKKGVELLTLTLADRSVVLKLPDIIAASIEDGELTVSTKSNSYTIKKTLNWFKSRAKTNYFYKFIAILLLIWK